MIEFYRSIDFPFCRFVDRRKWAVVIIDLVGGAKQVFYAYTKEISLAGRGAVRSEEKKNWRGMIEVMAWQESGICRAWRAKVRGAWIGPAGTSLT